MRRFFAAPLLAVALVFGALVAPVGAITGGAPDGDDHPQVALLLVPGITFCSGTLISETTILTAGHCTDGWSEIEADFETYEWDGTVMVSFDSEAEVDENWMPVGGTWYEASDWLTHPDYVSDDWPFTYDYGLLYLDDSVDITPATLADPGTLDPVINSKGQSPDLFDDVGYGIQGKTIGGGPPDYAITWQRKIAVQTEAPGNGSVSGLFHETWFITKNNPSAGKGGACGGDSGSSIFLHGTTEIVAVHTGGYNLGYEGVLCGRITSLNHRTDVQEVYDWIQANTQ
ncbi:MAG TPA: trypsin-like serine protease [Candidatus Limnocylindria bacterium]|nr:trypsin-like serine protease [Candidatus Limnocylindria bacterium]